MPRSTELATVLAAIFAAAGGLLATPAYAAPADEAAPMLAVDPTLGGGTDHYEPTLSQTQIKPAGIGQDDPTPEAPAELTSGEKAEALGAADQAKIQSLKKYRRRPTIFDHTTPGERHQIIAPYIEAGQVVDAALSPTSDVTTYSVMAAGIDAALEGRNNQGILSLRLERRQGWGKVASGWSYSGLARASSAIIQDALRLDVAGYASQVRVDSTGTTLPGTGPTDALVQTYTVYGGPSLNTDVGQVKVDGHYRIGYSSLGTPTAPTAPAGTGADIFAHSTVQEATLGAKVRPGDMGPVGFGIDGGYYQENISNLDQLARDYHARGEATIMVASDVALTGGVGYESVLVSSRDAVRDPVTGAPVYGADGRLLTDYSKPRQIALDSQGMIWDAGVTWRPSPRTEFQAVVGRRYGDFGGFGHFTYHPTSRQTINVLVYNNLGGFGGQMANSLTNLPTQFTVYRDGITGNISSCVGATTGGTCVTGALGSVRSTVYRSRGVTLAYAIDLGTTQVGLGTGYDHRTYISAPGTALAALNGKSDNYYWGSAFVAHEFDAHATLSNTLDVYWFQTGVALGSDAVTIRATSIYSYLFTKHLSASAAASVEGVNRQAIADAWSASAKVGMRYTF